MFAAAGSGRQSTKAENQHVWTHWLPKVQLLAAFCLPHLPTLVLMPRNARSLMADTSALRGEVLVQYCDRTNDEAEGINHVVCCFLHTYRSLVMNGRRVTPFQTQTGSAFVYGSLKPHFVLLVAFGEHDGGLQDSWMSASLEHCRRAQQPPSQLREVQI